MCNFTLQQPLFLKKLFEPISHNQNSYHHHHDSGHQQRNLQHSHHQNRRTDRQESGGGAKRYRDICRINNGFSACPY